MYLVRVKLSINFRPSRLYGFFPPASVTLKIFHANFFSRSGSFAGLPTSKVLLTTNIATSLQ